MNLPKHSVVTVLMSGLLSTVLAVFIANELSYRSHVLAVKRDVLRRFMGYRYVLTESGQDHGQGGEPFIALNEIFVVYAKDPLVITALKKMHEEINVQGRLSDNIVTLTKAMAKAAKLPALEVNDQFITIPFTPPAKS